jgi:hypothetical protein
MFEALSESAQPLGNRFGRSDLEKSDHRHRRLLRAHRERPRGAAPPSAASNSRRPMVTFIRPSRARCVNGTIPRHQRAVFTFGRAGTPLPSASELKTAEVPAELAAMWRSVVSTGPKRAEFLDDNNTRYLRI